MRKYLLLFTIFLCSIFIIKAGDDPYIIGEKLSIKSQVLDEERSLLIYLPDSYKKFNMSYPVMYLLDGGTHFHHVSGIVQYLSARGLMPEMIVVAILNVDRTRDFSPYPEPGVENSGGAAKFMSFIKDELIPFIDKTYRTEPYKLIIGHSLGGTFATYALVNFPEVFDGYIAISPFLHFQNSIFIDEIEENLNPYFKGKKQFYLTVGNEPQYFDPLDRFSKIMQTKMQTDFDFSYVKLLDENHLTVPHQGIYNGLLFIFSDWKLDPDLFVEKGIGYLDKHFKKLSKKYGYTIQPSEFLINNFGYYFVHRGKFETSLELFRENVRRFPKSANVYDSLGEVCEILYMFEDAEENYQKAVDIANKENHPNLSVYEKNLQRIENKLSHK